MTKPNIKPCPFCGEVLQLTKSDTWTHEAQSNGTCILATMAIPNDYEKTVKLWNTRTDTVDVKLQAAEEMAEALALVSGSFGGGLAITFTYEDADKINSVLQNWKETQDDPTRD